MHSRILFDALELLGKPVETLVQTLTVGRASSLDVPVALLQRVQAELFRDLGWVHGVWQILCQQHKASLANPISVTE